MLDTEVEVFGDDGDEDETKVALDSEENTNKKIFCGGISWQTSDAVFANYWRAYGELVDATIMRDAHTGASRGFGFVTFRDASLVDRIISQANTVTIDSHKVDIRRAVPKQNRRGLPYVPATRIPKVFVGGLPTGTSLEEFKAYFQRFGTVLDALIMMDRDTGRSRGFGFITFENEEQVEHVVNQGQHVLCGKTVDCKRAQPKTKPLPGGAHGGSHGATAVTGSTNGGASPLAAGPGPPRVLPPSVYGSGPQYPSPFVTSSPLLPYPEYYANIAPGQAPGNPGAVVTTTPPGGSTASSSASSSPPTPKRFLGPSAPGTTGGPALGRKGRAGAGQHGSSGAAGPIQGRDATGQGFKPAPSSTGGYYPSGPSRGVVPAPTAYVLVPHPIYGQAMIPLDVWSSLPYAQQQQLAQPLSQVYMDPSSPSPIVSSLSPATHFPTASQPTVIPLTATTPIPVPGTGPVSANAAMSASVPTPSVSFSDIAASSHQHIPAYATTVPLPIPPVNTIVQSAGSAHTSTPASFGHTGQFTIAGMQAIDPVQLQLHLQHSTAMAAQISHFSDFADSQYSGARSGPMLTHGLIAQQPSYVAQMHGLSLTDSQVSFSPQGTLASQAQMYYRAPPGALYSPGFANPAGAILVGPQAGTRPYPPIDPQKGSPPQSPQQLATLSPTTPSSTNSDTVSLPSQGSPGSVVASLLDLGPSPTGSVARLGSAGSVISSNTGDTTGTSGGSSGGGTVSQGRGSALFGESEDAVALPSGEKHIGPSRHSQARR